MTSTTRTQHFVPQFYLEQWSNSKGQITCHDIHERRFFSCNPVNALAQSYFYEEDRVNPDNRIENVLSKMEGICSTTFKKLDVVVSDSEGQHLDRALRSCLSTQDLNNLSTFAAYQYLRVPGAIDQKASESEYSGIPEPVRKRALNPGRFVESGYSHVSDKFKAMNLIILVSPGRELITSDWPCFDMKDSPQSPLLGEEIGREPRVICYFPLAPLLGVVFYSKQFSDNAQRVARLIVRTQTDGIVKNQNTLVVQQAERFVVASREEKFIFSIASKRKKKFSSA